MAMFQERQGEEARNVPEAELTMWEMGKCAVCWQDIEDCQCEKWKLREGLADLERRLLDADREVRRVQEEYRALEMKRQLLQEIAGSRQAQIQTLQRQLRKEGR